MVAKNQKLLGAFYCVFHDYLSFCQLHNSQHFNNEHCCGFYISVMEGTKLTTYLENESDTRNNCLINIGRYIIFNLS